MRNYHIYGTLLTFSLALFGNTWSAGFAFDDNFAVVNNGDVTGSAPLAEIWQHDFWGQQIRSDQSHKSYRPVTILSLRVINWAGKLLPNGVNWHSADKHDNTGGLNAFPFHLANVVVHAVNSCLVYRAALLLIALKAPFASLSPARQQHAHIAAQGNGRVGEALQYVSGVNALDAFGCTRQGDRHNHGGCPAVAAYAQLRSWLAGDHLVRIYRKVENPIPFADPLTARLTTGFLHAKYFHFLLFPLHLSADWSFACVPWRTVTRNLDWEDEETLFVAAQKVCMNSGKVRLNSGILERRHSNWDQALHHFRRAREIDDTYCEPDYWIGASLLQQGKHVQLGLMELEKALRCKYVAANALNALQQVYQLMGSEAKEKAASHQAWARILLKPELGRVVEACQLLEQVALEKVQLGGSYASAQDVMKPCLVHLKQAQNASQQAAAAPAPADAAFPSCRLLQAKDGVGEERQVATVHLHLIHLVQSADSEDPWFQLEWAEIMALENRVTEASLHLQVAAALFTTHLHQVPSVRKRGIANPKDAAQLAVMCLRRVHQVQPSDICQVRHCCVNYKIVKQWGMGKHSRSFMFLQLN
ncbi:hypothetical protein WJX79_005166 [Trebouxia sp. C0005]